MKNATQGKSRFCRGMRGVNVVAAAESWRQDQEGGGENGGLSFGKQDRRISPPPVVAVYNRCLCVVGVDAPSVDKRIRADK